MRRSVFLVIATALAVVMLYLSRFWPFDLWSRPGLFGWGELPPQGGLLGRWLRGTDAAPYELIIWGVGCFIVLTYAQKLLDRITPATPTQGEENDG